jgi:RHS repeat-associated protein
VGLAESWSYDASGRPLAAARGGVALAWAYDAFGRVSAETRDGRGVTATRDADGRLASFLAPGIAQSLAYDAAGRLTTVAVPGQADAYVAYDRSGLESWRLARAGGSDVLRTDLHRDAAGRPLEVAATSSSGAQAGLLRTLDPEGAPLTQVDQSGKGWSFSRDLGTRELLGAQEIGGGSASVATGYDLAGLRATHSDLLASGAWSTNAAGETSQARGRPVVNDLLGRVTSLDGWNHTYSCDGLLLSSEPSAPAEGSRRSVHAYDALGRRVRTTVQAYVGGQWVAFSTTERDFLGRLPLGIETSFADGSAKSWRFMRGPDASGTLEGAGGARGVLAVLKDASSWKAVAADTLGNVLALAGTSGDFTRRTFDPWGNPLTRDASGSLRASTLSERRADYDALPLAWASQEVDPDTGLTHYHFREYSPSLGGWLTQDPIGLAGGYLNLRSYLGNRPADELDVWGEGSPDVFHKSMQSTAELKATREVLRKELERTEGIVRRAAPIQKNGFILPSGPYMPTPEFITPDQTECDEAFGDYAAAKERLNELYHAIKIFNRVIEIREATYGKINKRDRLWDDTDGNVREFVAVYNAFLLPEDGHPMTTHGLWASAKLTEKVGKAEYTAIELMLTGGAAAAERFLIRGSAAVVRPTLRGAARVVAGGGDDMIDVYRVFGGDARAQGFSWTTVDPRTVKNFRGGAGLPSGGASGSTNTADFLIKGRVQRSDVLEFKLADPLDGNRGGFPELRINPNNVRLNDFSVLNP